MFKCGSSPTGRELIFGIPDRRGHHHCYLGLFQAILALELRANAEHYRKRKENRDRQSVTGWIDQLANGTSQAAKHLWQHEEWIAKIQAAKARLEAEAQARAAAEQRERDVATARREAVGKSRSGRPPVPLDPTPNDKAQTNSTDPEAKIMKRNNKGFDYCYNAQAVVDSAHQIIVAAEITAAAGEGRGAQLGGGRNRVAARCARPTPTAPPKHGRQRRLQRNKRGGRDGGRLGSVLRHGPTEASRAGSSTPQTAGGDWRKPQSLDVAQAPHGHRPPVVCGPQTHCRAGILSDQTRSRLPQISVTWFGTGLGRMAIGLPDAQLTEDLVTEDLEIVP